MVEQGQFEPWCISAIERGQCELWCISVGEQDQCVCNIYTHAHGLLTLFVYIHVKTYRQNPSLVADAHGEVPSLLDQSTVEPN